MSEDGKKYREKTVSPILPVPYSSPTILLDSTTGFLFHYCHNNYVFCKIHKPDSRTSGNYYITP